MLKKNLILILVIVIGTSLVLSGCYERMNNYYENEKMIVRESDSYNYRTCKGSVKEDSADLEFVFTGSDTLWTIQADEDNELRCSYHSDIRAGKFKTVLITPEKEIQSTIEGSTKAEILLKLKKGTNVIKIVGEDSKGSLKINIENSKQEGIEIKAANKDNFPWN